jgi:hypothetical protein
MSGLEICPRCGTLALSWDVRCGSWLCKSLDSASPCYFSESEREHAARLSIRTVPAAAADEGERALLAEIANRDRLEAVVAATHVALGGDGEWCPSVFSDVPPPHSGDLSLDVPVLAAELRTDRDRLLAALWHLVDRLKIERAVSRHSPVYQAAVAEAQKCLAGRSPNGSGA